MTEEQRLKRNKYMKEYWHKMPIEKKEKYKIKIREWQQNNKEKCLISRRKTHKKRYQVERMYTKQWRLDNPGKNSEHCKNQRIKLLEEIVREYGGKCSCTGCNEIGLLFMTIDHEKNNGAQERAGLGDGPSAKNKKGRAGVNFYRYLKKMGYPKEGYRLMCYNCNCGRARNGGICPHLQNRSS